MAQFVVTAALQEPVVRVKVWGPDGTVLYSDEPAVIGERFDSGRRELSELSPGQVVAEISDLSAPENRYERTFGELMEVYTRIQTPGGSPILFETYQRLSSISENERQLLASSVPVLLVALVAFGVLLVPLVWVLARRVQRASREREQLLERALDASDRERRRIAGDLHDGPVQELAGLSMRLAAEAEGAADTAQRDALRETASAVRGSVRTLRSAIVGIYPPNLQTAGLGPALSDLTARLPTEGLAVTLEVADPAGYGARVDELLYRATQEALRNVERHANASRVSVRVTREGSVAVLEVADDGRGPGGGVDAPVREADGHFGLQILRDLLADAGGTLTIEPGPRGGTVVHVEVPT
jgi:signal transduction histidine kinase